MNEIAQQCLNPDCNAILFVSGKMSPDTDARGVDRSIEFKKDKKGTYIECPRCGSKHTILMWKGPEGSGGRWKIGKLRS